MLLKDENKFELKDFIRIINYDSQDIIIDIITIEPLRNSILRNFKLPTYELLLLIAES